MKNLRKIISLSLALVMLLSSLTMFASAEEELPFTDVKTTDWAYEGIKYATENGLMNGTGGGKFSPLGKLTRGMVITVLYRLEGSPAVDFDEKDFLDVPAGQYYSNAASWAVKNEVVTGTSTDMWGTPAVSPDRDITRQELATLFVRFANYRHVKMEEGTLDAFDDRDSVASWAKDAMEWATAAGLINGTGNGKMLSPEGDATREQFATIIMRYCEADFDYNIFYGEPKPLHSYTEPEYPLVSAADFYVAVDGDDKNPGTLEKPFASFEKARDAVRALKAEKPGKAITVAFKAGNYGTLDNITFTEADTGTADAPITYCKYGDGPVVFTNGIKIPEGDFKPVDESDYYLLGGVDKSKVYKVDLTGIVDTLGDNNILFSETAPCYEARIPNRDSSGVDKHYFDVTTTYNEKESILLQSYLPGIVEKFRTVEGMKVTGFLRYGWLTDTFPVKSYDPETKVLTFDFENFGFPNGYHINDVVLAFEERFDDQIFFHNLSDQIDFEGEYWFDSNTKMLYVYKPEGDYHISTGGTFMYIAPGAEYLTFLGLDFSTSSANGIEIAADHLTFDRCSVSNIGGTNAIVTVFRDGNEPGTRWSTFTGCEFYNFVDTGLNIEASYRQCHKTLTPSGNVIENNYFHDFGTPAYRSQAILLRWEVGCKVYNNEFKNGSRAAVVYSDSIDVEIMYNVFENMMCSSMDYGIVYSYRQITNRDNKISYNLFKNNRYYTWVYSIYVDGSWGQEFTGNIFYESTTLGIILNGGRDNLCRDNIMISHTNNRAAFVNNWDLAPDNWEQEAKDTIFNTLASLPKKGDANYEMWKERWPILFNYTYDIADLGKYECIYTPVNHIWDNHFFGSTFNDPIILEYGDIKGNVDHKMDEDVGFVCPALGDYRITDGATVNDIHFEKIGRY